MQLYSVYVTQGVPAYSAIETFRRKYLYRMHIFTTSTNRKINTDMVNMCLAKTFEKQDT